jgi:hypothetical protein
MSVCGQFRFLEDRGQHLARLVALDLVAVAAAGSPRFDAHDYSGPGRERGKVRSVIGSSVARRMLHLVIDTESRDRSISHGITFR